MAPAHQRHDPEEPAAPKPQQRSKRRPAASVVPLGANIARHEIGRERFPVADARSTRARERGVAGDVRTLCAQRSQHLTQQLGGRRADSQSVTPVLGNLDAVAPG